MAYLSNCGYQNDVFISYAHADNEPLFDSVRWVSNFVDDLGNLIARKLGRKKDQTPLIWMDDKLARNQPLDMALANALRETATYLIIMSPAYLASEWCKEERKQFFEILKEKGSRTRVFVVEIDEVNREKYPMDIDKNLVAYTFWDKESGPNALTLGIPDRNTGKYYPRLVDVATDIANELIRIEGFSPNSDATTSQVSKGNIFLAEVTDDLDDKREELKRYLKDEGFKVLPEENWFQSYEPEGLKANIDSGLSNCLIYVQLLSNLPGKKLQGSSDSISKFQFDVAKASGKKMMVWRSPDLKIEAAKDISLKNILESVYVRAEGIEEFKLACKTAATPPPPTPEIDTESDNPKFVYICTDLKDRDYSETIIKNAIKQAGFGCSLPIRSNKASVVKNYQKLNFIQSYATLFVYCKTEPDGVFNQILDCYKIKSLRKEPFRAVAIFDGPPKETDDGMIDIELPSFEISNLNCRESITEFTEKFLKKL